MRTTKKGAEVILAFWVAFIAACTLGAYIHDKISVSRLRRELSESISPIRGNSFAEEADVRQIRAVAIRRLAVGLYEIRPDDRRVALAMLCSILHYQTDAEWWAARHLHIETLDPYLLVEYMTTDTLPSTEDD